MERRILPSCPTHFNLRLGGLCDFVSTKVSVGGLTDLSVVGTSLAGSLVCDVKGFAI